MDIQAYPFKRPFKGKRELYRDRDAARQLLDKLLSQSARLIRLWGEDAPDIGLSLQEEKRRSIPRIRWRASVRVFGHQKFLDFTSPEIQDMRNHLSAPALWLVAGFEQRRVSLNARIECTFRIIESLDAFDEQSNAVTEWLPEHLREPLIRRGN